MFSIFLKSFWDVFSFEIRLSFISLIFRRRLRHEGVVALDVSLRVLRNLGFGGLALIDSIRFCGFCFCFSGSTCFCFCDRFRCNWCGDDPFRLTAYLLSLVDSMDCGSDLLNLVTLDLDKDLVSLDLDILDFAAGLDPAALDFFGFLSGRNDCSSDCFGVCSGFFVGVLFQSITCLSSWVVSSDFDEAAVVFSRLRGLDLRTLGDFDGSVERVSVLGLALRDFTFSRREVIGLRRFVSGLWFSVFFSSSDLLNRPNSSSGEDSIDLVRRDLV